MATFQLPPDPPRKRRWIGTSMHGLVILIIVGYTALASTLICIQMTESSDSTNDFSPVQLHLWQAVGGLIGLAFAVGCLRFRLFKTLAAVISFWFFVYVVGFSFIIELNAGGDASGLAVQPVSARGLVLLIIIASAVFWCLQKARGLSRASGLWTGSLGITTTVSAALILFASYVWAFGIGNPKSPQIAAEQLKPLPRLDPTWENVQNIIATTINVPKDKIVPTARFDEDLNVGEPDIEEMIETFGSRFGLDTQSGDMEMMITVQDAIDYVNSPEDFRASHPGQSRFAPKHDDKSADVQ